MSLMPLPKIQSLFLANTSSRIHLGFECPTIAELGRFHFSSCEVSQIKKEEKKMAFQVIDMSTLPVREFGRKATEPKISISEAGTFVFNALIKEAWGFDGKVESKPSSKKDAKAGDMEEVYIPSGNEVTKLLVRFDAESRMIAFNGFKNGAIPKNVKEASLLAIRSSKDGSQIFAPGSGICNQVKYDFSKSGNQSFAAKWDEKNKFFLITLPEGSLTPKPKQVRAKKATTGMVAANGKPNGAAVNMAPPAEEDLLDLN